MFRRRSQQSATAVIAGRGTGWLTDSRLRQMFDRDLEDGEQILGHGAVTLTCEKFDRPVTGTALLTDRTLRIRWGLATGVRQSLHVGYDRVRWVEVPLAEPRTAHLAYFDASRTTVGWYQELVLRADSDELTLSLPGLVGAYNARPAPAHVEPAPPATDDAAGVPVPAEADPLQPGVARASRARVGAHRRRRLARR